MDQSMDEKLKILQSNFKKIEKEIGLPRDFHTINKDKSFNLMLDILDKYNDNFVVKNKVSIISHITKNFKINHFVVNCNEYKFIDVKELYSLLDSYELIFLNYILYIDEVYIYASIGGFGFTDILTKGINGRLYVPMVGGK